MNKKLIFPDLKIGQKSYQESIPCHLGIPLQNWLKFSLQHKTDNLRIILKILIPNILHVHLLQDVFSHIHQFYKQLARDKACNLCWIMGNCQFGLKTNKEHSIENRKYFMIFYKIQITLTLLIRTVESRFYMKSIDTELCRM